MKVHIVERTHWVAHYSDDERYIDGHDSRGSEILAVTDEEYGELTVDVGESQDCDSHDSLKVLGTVDSFDIDEVIEALKKFQTTEHKVPEDPEDREYEPLTP